MTCAECDQEAIVGWGNPPQWLCIQHFEHKLEAVQATVERLKGALLHEECGCG